MANRDTVKSNINGLNVPTVTNAKLRQMLNDNLADNVRFREDVGATQSATSSAITVNFEGKDRIDLTRTGGALNISVAGMGDGEEKSLLITKTVGQEVTFVGVTDVTPIIDNVTAVGLVLYSIVRKGSNYFARAWVDTVKQATDNVIGVAKIASAAENNALENLTNMCVPGRLPSGSKTQKGLVRLATDAEYVDKTAGVVPDAAQIKGDIDTMLALKLFATRMCLAEFIKAGTTITQLKGNLTLGISKPGTGRYIISHNIGHTNYIVLGVGNTLLDNTTSVRSMVSITNNSVQIEVSDDGSSNDAGQRILIVIFD